jgi:hypothetical protein
MGIDNNGVVGHSRTARFSVLESFQEIEKNEKQSNTDQDSSLPVLDLVDLLLHAERNKTTLIQKQLRKALQERGFCLLTCSPNSRPGRVFQDLQSSVRADLFPANGSTKNVGQLPTSNTTYVSEKGVPMYKLGYELAEDEVREFYRIAASSQDGDDACQLLPDTYRQIWRQGMGLCRQVTDTALDLLTRDLPNAPDREKRPGSGSASWNRPVSLAPRERRGDYSVLYAMHYFNDADENANANDNGSSNCNAQAPADRISLGAHVDPSLLVMEPFLTPDSRGLQVWDRISGDWMDCDGPNSPCVQLNAGAGAGTGTGTGGSSSHEHQQEGHGQHQVVSLLFGGKALAAHTDIEATLHRVVAGSRNRRAVIYGQKVDR